MRHIYANVVVRWVGVGQRIISSLHWIKQ
jgi:hypothetical protein